MTNDTKHKSIAPSIVFLIICFLLSFIDLFLLRDAVHEFLPQDPNKFGSSMIALFAGLVGMSMMVFAGYQRAMATKSGPDVRRMIEFLVWIAFGFIIVSIRIVHAIYYPTDVQAVFGVQLDVSSLVFVPMLFALYITTGLIAYTATMDLFNILNTEEYGRIRKRNNLDAQYRKIDNKIGRRREKLSENINSLRGYEGVCHEVEKIYDAEYEYINSRREAAAAIIESAILESGFPAEILREFKNLDNHKGKRV